MDRTFLLNEILVTLRSYSNFNFSDCYYMLFNCCLDENEKELSKKVFYEIILEAIRFKDPWVVEEIDSVPLAELGLYEFSVGFLKIAPRKKYRPSNKQVSSFCVCCDTYPLTVDEIQNFPIVNSKEYIDEAIARAYKEKDIGKRNYLVARLICDLRNNPEFYKLWEQAANNGINISVNSISSEDVFNKERFKTLIKIFSKRDKENDHLIDDVVQILLENEKWDLAYYILLKVSLLHMRIFYTVWNIINNKKNTEKEIMFLRKVCSSLSSYKKL